METLSSRPDGVHQHPDPPEPEDEGPEQLLKLSHGHAPRATEPPAVSCLPMHVIYKASGLTLALLYREDFWDSTFGGLLSSEILFPVLSPTGPVRILDVPALQVCPVAPALPYMVLDWAVLPGRQAGSSL